MAFVREFRNVKDEFPEWEYLNEIGVRDMFNKPIEKSITALVVDWENNYYLIPQGYTSISREDKEIYYFALCIDDKVLNLEASENHQGNIWDKTYERYWNVSKIKFPDNWTFDGISKEEVGKIITEAFTVKSYNEVFTKERIKNVKVEITAEF